MKVLVKYNDSYHYWVDTVTMHDEYDYACAILVSSKGVAFPVCLDKVEVVDDSYNYEKQIEKRIAELKSEHLAMQAEMEAKLKAVGYNPFGPTLKY